MSVWCIAVIAAERYRKMFSAKITSQNQNKTLLKRAKTVAAFVWVTSFLIFCLPLYFVVDYKELSNRGEWCGPNWVSPKLQEGYIILLTLFSYILPLIVISFTYLAISRVINRSNAFIQSSETPTGKGVHVVMAQENQCTSLRNRLNQNKRAKRILTPVILVFAVTVFPLNVFRLTTVFLPAVAVQEYYNNLLYVVSVLVVLNSSINPIIYSIVSRDFREEIKYLCRRGCVICSRPDFGHPSCSRRVQQLRPLFPLGVFKKLDPYF